MARRRPRRKPLGTIWEVPDELGRRIEPILVEFWPKKPTGRHVAHWRKMLNAILFRMRRGCQWGQLPERFGPKSTVPDWFQRWVEGGVFERIGAVLVAECDELGGVQWQWQSGDAMRGQARFGGEKDGQESHRSRHDRDQDEPADRRRGGAAGRGDRRGERRRAEDAEGDDRGGRGRAARPGGGGAELGPGQGVGQPQRSRGGDGGG
jgi:transposase